MARRIKWRIKRRETDPAGNQFTKCSPPSGTQRFTELGREEKGEGGDRGDLVEKKESPKWEGAVKPVISLPSLGLLRSPVGTVKRTERKKQSTE